MLPIQSPCIGVCQCDEKGYCRGCFRTREERFQWTKLSPLQQRNVIRLAHNRKKRYLRALQQANQRSQSPASQQANLPLDFPDPHREDPSS
ncbi:MAG: hypothetical protein CENE_02688 [Candidatus Celerinatantimonas neptuna]|nr:MAG: hypothetical protein CENE_02688 [Candidatus Celerinatantimonas neptuna]